MPTKPRSSKKPREKSPTFTAAILTISDSCSRGKRKDASGPAVAASLKKSAFRIVTTKIIPDKQIQIQNTLLDLASQARFIATTGGTGIAPRDVTPEATRAICDRLLDGIAETMRRDGSKKTPFAALSRGLCGVHGKTLILNLPGSPKGAVESLSAVIALIPHALNLLDGKTEHE
jgi:molybdopterin adenylyltransferase